MASATADVATTGRNSNGGVQTLPPDMFFPHAESQAGKSPEFGHCYHNTRKIADAYNKFIKVHLQTAKWSNPLYIGGREVTRDQWTDIDAVARTMMAEIGDEAACFKRDGKKNLDYPLAFARIMVNRSQQPKRYKDMAQILNDDKRLDTPGNYAVTKPSQFSVWNAGAKDEEGAPCPNLKSPNWPQILDFAKSIVLEPETIKKKTEGMNSKSRGGKEIYNYTSGCHEHFARPCAGYLPIQNARVGDTQISDIACFETWQDTDVAPDKGCLSKVSACCSPLDKGDKFIADKREDCERTVGLQMLKTSFKIKSPRLLDGTEE